MRFNFEGDKITIVKNSEHGLGHLLTPKEERKREWYREWWEDILKLHYGLLTREDLNKKYENMFALSILTISSPAILKRFEEFNKNRGLKDQIKAYNFLIVGQSNVKGVKPIAPICKNSQTIVHKPFIDYSSGKVLCGMHY